MRGAERVVHVGIAELAQVRTERRIARLFAGIESQILYEHHVARTKALRPPQRFESRDVGRQVDRNAEEFGEPLGDWGQRKRRVHCAFWTS